MLELGKCSLSISRVRGGGKEPISIVANDRVSRLRLFECRVSLEQFAEALTGTGRVDCTCSFNRSDKIGKTRQHKTESVEVPERGCALHLDALKELIAKHETDGWQGRVADLNNYHNRSGDGRYSVLFERWVDNSEGEEQ